VTTATKRWTAALLLVVLAVGVVVAYERRAGTSVPAKAAAVPAVAVEVVAVRVAPMADRVTSYGNLVALRSVNIVPETPGQVEKILFKDGQFVDAGTPLAVMDRHTAEAQVNSSRAQAEASQQNLRRTQSLAHQGLESTYSLEQAQSRTAASEADLMISQEKLYHLTLRAPFAGTLGTRYVDAGAFLNGGEKIVRLDDNSELQIEFRMPSSVIMQATQGAPVQVAIPSKGEELSVAGALSFIDPAVSTDTRSVLLRAVVPNEGQQLRPGLFVRVSLELDVHQNALVVPVEAVLSDLSGSYVYVVTQNIARRQDATVGLSDGRLTELTSGVKAGDDVVRVGQFRLQDGDPVKVVQPAAAKANG
jgi:membrane fusion protein (multidrug efflux system)